MPNLAFHLEVLNQVINQLVSNGDSRGDVMAKHKKFAALGALGPDLLRYLPVGDQLADKLASLAAQPPGQGQLTSLSLAELSELFFSPLGGVYSVVFRQLVIPAWPALNRIKSFLDNMDAVAQSENLLTLQSMIGQANSIQSEATSLQSLPSTVESLAGVVGQIIFLSAPWMEHTFLPLPLPPHDDPTANRLYEFLRWHHTGEFALNLLSKATANPDKQVRARQQAYAYGYLSHLASSVCGEPFVNNITGGPYRMHWWRHRLVGNFIDSWTYGFFRSHAQMQGDEPSPPYASWKPLCSANIQVEFDVAGLAGTKSGGVPDAVKAVASGKLGGLQNQFPAGLAQLLMDTVNATYPAAAQPVAGFSADKFKEAYVGAFAVYWFMTSGSGPVCNNPLGPPPANCTSAPDWITNGALPTPQQAGLNTQGATCAALLAIAALLLVLTGALTAGVIALIAAMNAPIVDWDKVRCNLFWLRKTLVDLENALRDALVQSGLAYPPPPKLGTTDTNGNTRPAADSTPGTGVPFCRSNSKGANGYPKALDDTNLYADFNFASYPVSPVGPEAPLTADLIPPGLYPNFVVNGTSLGLNNSIRTDGAGFPTSPKVANQQVYGDAVSNAVDLIQHDGVGLHNYNLDADRGYGWKPWRPAAGWSQGYLPTLPE